jgi:putative PEP-CTERM system histidine kinase
MFNFYLGLSILAGSTSLGLALWVMLKDRHARANQILAIGMVFLGTEAVINGISVSAYDPIQAYQWQRVRVMLSGFHPGIWLLFGMVFGNSDYQESFKKWKWPLALILLLPFLIFVGFPSAVFVDVHSSIEKKLFLFRIGLAGYVFHIIILLGFVAVLVELEKILRGSAGRARWQVKFLILGLVGLWGERIYEISQTILYRVIDLELQVLNMATLIAANGLVGVGIRRLPAVPISFYPSQSFLFGSITLLLAGAYFLSIGLLAKIAGYFGADYGVMLAGFIVFLSLLGLGILFYSDRLRWQLKRFITLYLSRPAYDYQKEWIEFTRETSSILDIRKLAGIIAGRISKMMEVLSVTIWLVDIPLKKAEIAGSTSISEKNKEDLSSLAAAVLEMIRAIRDKKVSREYNFLEGDWSEEEERKRVLAKERIEYCFPVVAGDRVLGAITIGQRVREHNFSIEDFELLKTIADQTAASLLNLKLSEELLQAKEIEAFQKLATFLLHDLKNLASTLSLTLSNMPIHFENPEFRRDALQVMEQSLGKIKNMCSGLSLLSQGTEMKKELIDLNHLAKEILKNYAGTANGIIVKKFALQKKMIADSEQIGKVLTNLILNANEALKEGGEIRVETRQENGWAVLSVTDTGCGIAKEFMERSLFRPFKTTKKQGMGIGLFHSKMIVEAHGGRIEVESGENRGTTFRVMLPMK